MSDQIERLRIIIEADGIPRLADGTKLTAQEVAKLGDVLQQTSKKLEDTGLRAETAGRRVGAMGREIAQGDWRGAAVQMGQLAAESGAFSGGLGLVRLGLGGAAVALGVYATAMFQAEKETTRQANALLLTGNYAGLVDGQLNSMARSAAAGINANIGGTRQTMEQLVGTGRVTKESLTEMTQAVELVSQASGQNRAKVVGDFAGMADGVAKWAADHNKSYHFLTFDQYQHIKALEDEGRAQEAMQVTSKALSDHLKNDVGANLGYLERLLKTGADAWSNWWDKALNAGRRVSTTTQLEDLEKQLDAELNPVVPAGRAKKPPNQAVVRQLEDRIALKRIEVDLEQRLAELTSEAAAEEERKIKAARAKPTGPARVDPEIEAQRRLMAEIGGLTGSFEKDMARRNALLASGKLSQEQYNKSVQDLVAKQPYMLAAAQAEAAIAKAREAAEKDLADTRKRAGELQDRQAEAQEREISALMASNDQLGQQAQAVGLTSQELARLTLTRIEAAIAEERLNLVGADGIAGEEGSAQRIERKIRLLERQRDLTKELTDKQAADELKKQNEADSKKFSEDLRRDVTDSLQRAFESGKSPADALASTLANTIKTRLTRALAEAIANPILKPLEQVVGGGGGGLGGLFNGGAGLFSDSFGGTPDFDWSWFFGGAHSGALVGSEATFMRAMNPAAFAGANRFHTGGLVGGEVPIIAKKGEGVFTEGQMSKLAPVGSAAPQVTVNVQTMPGQTASVQQRQGRDGLNIDVIVQQIEDQLAGNIAAGAGAIGQAIEGRYNLRTAVT